MTDLAGPGRDPSADQRALRVVIADDHTLFRDGLRTLLTSDGMELLADLPNGTDALEAVARHRPDIVLLDVQMPGPDAATMLRRVLEVSPSSRVIFLSMFQQPGLVRELEAQGAAAYLRKTVDWDVLRATIRAAAGGMVMRHASAPGDDGDDERLTPDDLALLRMVAVNLSNRRMAEALFVSESTVKRQLAAVYTKLGASSRVEALARAVQDGLIIP